MATNLASQHRTAHIKLDAMQLNESFQDNTIIPEYIPTDANPADLLTKGLAPHAFTKHCRTLLGLSDSLDLYTLSRELA